MSYKYRPVARVLLSSAAGVFLLASGCSHKGPPEYQGYVEGKFVYVASPESGRLDRLAVARGETIAVRHPLFALDAEPEAAAMRQAQEMLRSSEAKLTDLEAGKRPAEIDITRARLQQAQAEQKQALAILRSDESQYDSGGIPQTDLIGAQAAADVNSAKVQELEADLAVDALPARAQQIRAQVRQVGADRATLAQTEWRLQQKQVASPRQGLIFDTLYREGEWVAAGNPVVEILPPENIEVRFYVPEPVVGRLHMGQNVTVHCDGCSAPVAASITFVSPQSEYTPPVIYSNENRSKLVFMIIAKPSEAQAPALHPGQPVEVVLE
ncbi:MAG TPA: HlyD family efflux transporter periplasmic adaptor subunit [Acidobacteriaceae bacterium]|jgi:HlyD family secretion protein|nr:HlyD family efflux transporter periplasmic adaptor subunit [Acidobacteriaceae bacterium]